jgi:cell division protein FtsL
MDAPISPVHQLIKGQALGLIMLGLLAVGSAIGVVYTKHIGRGLHIKLQQLHQNRDVFHVEWTQLLLESSTLGSDIRVEKIAREELGMNLPPINTVVVIRP